MKEKRYCPHCKKETVHEITDKEYSSQTNEFILLYECTKCKGVEWE